MKQRIALVVIVCASSGCTHYLARQAYEAGDYLAAHAYYNKDNCLTLAQPEAVECTVRAQEVEEGLAGAARYFGERAQKLVSNRRSIQYNDYLEAKRHLQLGLRLLPDGARTKRRFTRRIQRIENDLDGFQQEYDEQYAKLEGLLGHQSYEQEVWKEIMRTFERLRVLRIALRQEDRRLKELAQRYVTKFDQAGRHDRAMIATVLTTAVDFRGTEFHTESQIDDDQLIFFAFVAHRSQRQLAERRAKVEALLVQIDAEMQREQKEDARVHVQEALELEPGPGALRRLRKILAAIDRPPERKRPRRRVRRARPAPKAPKPNETPVSTHSEPDASLTEMREIFDALARQFESGKVFEAIVELEQVVRDLEGAQQDRAKQLQRLWRPDRKRLIRENLREAERLFVDEDPASLEYYRRVLQLNPTGTDRKHVNERIDILTRILAQ